MDQKNNCFVEIQRLQNIYNEITKKIENEELHSFFAQNKVEDLLKAEIRLKVFFKHLKMDNEVIEKLTILINKTKQLSHDITNFIYLERKFLK